MLYMITMMSCYYSFFILYYSLYFIFFFFFFQAEDGIRDIGVTGVQTCALPISSSVVQTGVKSFGCENRMAHPLPIHSWKLIGPSVVSAVKFGASSLMRSDIATLLL